MRLIYYKILIQKLNIKLKLNENIVRLNKINEIKAKIK